MLKGTPKEMTEKYLLTKGFKSPVLFYTYDGSRKIGIKRVQKYDVVLQDNTNLKKIDVLFALASDDLATIKKGVRIQKSIKAENLRMPEKRTDRPEVVSDDDLKGTVNKDVRIVLRSGHVLRGRQVAFFKYNLVLSIHGGIILVYRHGILEYALTPAEK